MKNLVKFFLIASIFLSALVSVKIILELYETRVKKYINVD